MYYTTIAFISRRLRPTRKLERLKEERSKKRLTKEEELKELAYN
jgi:hypothetical protein